jgi:hypothetical protein
MYTYTATFHGRGVYVVANPWPETGATLDDQVVPSNGLTNDKGLTGADSSVDGNPAPRVWQNGSTSADVTVSVDRTTLDSVSQLDVGVTHMQYSLDAWGDADALARGKQLLRQAATYQNQHIHGFGVGPINPVPGVYDWSSLDRRVQLMRDTGAIPVITLCCAPTWMVDPNWTDGTDWSKLAWAPLPEHEDHFAELSRQVALRYPDVEYFQVWNELKGMYDSTLNRWDYERYTRLYNKVYDAIKGARPSAKIGGPYVV